MLAEIGLSGLLKEYSPTRHLASAIFPFSDTSKYLLMLTAYLDETGHSKDERQRFNGMAGLLAPSAKWERLEVKWKRTLREFRLPHFHTKDFANRRREYEGWSEDRRQKLYGRLLTHIEAAHPFPIGSILAMSDYNSLTNHQRSLFGDPYHIGFLSTLSQLTAIAGEMRLEPGTKIAPVFSDHVEFRHAALRGYELLCRHREVKQWIDSPVFRDMRDLVPLQAADIVAYELYKEFERTLFRPNAPQRYGYQVICRMPQRLGQILPSFAFHNRSSLNVGGDTSGGPDYGRPVVSKK